MYLLTHGLSLTLCQHDGYMAAALEDPRVTTLCSRPAALHRRPFVNPDAVDLQFVDIRAHVVFGIGDRRKQNLADDLSGFLVAEHQQLISTFDRQTTNL